MIERTYKSILSEHRESNRQMAFLTGPRQVGKTTTGRQCATHYLDWDDQDDQAVIVGGPARLATHLGLMQLPTGVPAIS